jgi:hypothetical protein
MQSGAVRLGSGGKITYQPIRSYVRQNVGERFDTHVLANVATGRLFRRRCLNSLAYASGYDTPCFG